MWMNNSFHYIKMKLTFIHNFILSIWTIFYTTDIVFSGTSSRNSTNCSSQCYRSTCDKSSLECDDGCRDGYNPPACNTICGNSSYGRNCSSNCPERCSTKRCDFVTGFCISKLNIIERHNPEPHSESSDNTITITVIILIIIPAAILGGYVVWRLRKRQKESDALLLQPNTELGDEVEEVVYLEMQPIVSEDFGEYTVVDISEVKASRAKPGPKATVTTDTPITLKQLESCIGSFKKEALYKQFKLIFNNEKATTEHGLCASNKKKNRYTNIYPYDHTRVHLEDSADNSDYINASYIRGVDDEVAFITSQGPTAATVNDFIMMLWEQNVDVVVMLTNLIEESKHRCERYWPDEDGDLFGPINVSLLSTQHFTDYTIRKLRLQKDSESHDVVQYQFTSWPDKGIPDSPWALADFQQRISCVTTTALPVVHCSAGVGRSGTYIALHNVLVQAMKAGTVDFFKTVKKLREDRMYMVQTKEQYVFLHIASYVAILCRKSLVSISKIQEKITSSPLGPTNWKAEIDLEFKILCTICQEINLKAETVDDDRCNKRKEKEEDHSKGKRRSKSLIAKHIPYLRSESHDGSFNLDAVLVPGLQCQDKHILTALPKPSAVKDFWRLILQYKIALIIAFEVDEADNDSDEYMMLYEALKIYTELT